MGAKNKTPGAILLSFSTAIPRTNDGFRCVSNRKHTQADIFVMFQIRQGTIIKPLMLVLFLRNKQFLNYLQAALRGYVKPGHWNHFTKLDLTNTALQSLTSINKCVRKPLALKGKDT